jgi:hypothetical protein
MKITLAIMFTAIALSAPAANHAHAASHAAHPKYALYALDKGAAARDLEAFDDGVACIEALEHERPAPKVVGAAQSLRTLVARCGSSSSPSHRVPPTGPPDAALPIIPARSMPAARLAR